MSNGSNGIAKTSTKRSTCNHGTVGSSGRESEVKLDPAGAVSPPVLHWPAFRCGSHRRSHSSRRARRGSAPASGADAEPVGVWGGLAQGVLADRPGQGRAEHGVLDFALTSGDNLGT